MKALLKIIAIVAALIALSIFLPVHVWLLDFISWVRDAGVWGALLFVAIYIAATVMLIPGSILTLGAGFVYGPLWGTLLFSPASVMGAFIAFSLARGRLRPRVEDKVQGNTRFQAVDKAVGDQGFKIVTLLRLSPVFPFVFLNYALGLTRVRRSRYILASFLGMLPGTFLYTYLGSLVPSVAELAAGSQQGAPATQNLFLWGGFAATLIATVYITRLARRALREAVPEAVENLDPEIGNLEEIRDAS